MESSGKTLTADFDLAEAYPKASIGYGLVELPTGANPLASNPQNAKDSGRIRTRGTA
jgi:hypothetical protein